ncbi:MAG TPA: hypothetical protein DIT09_09735 [Glutamicibacter sp.]|uniref:hypothetical protein n=1 Tax=Glutamicibacter arilaitensis TaxID=256701 RepID=UPI000EBAFD76|nr:hypothetical protein [Glutamicibacter sp.]
MKFSAALRANTMKSVGSELIRVNKNRCLEVGGVELRLDKFLRSTTVKVIWDHGELTAVSMDGELIACFVPKP